MSRSDRINKNIVRQNVEEYQKHSYWLPFSALTIGEAFNPDELKELESFRKEVEEAGNSNKKKAQAIEKYSTVALKLLKLAKVVV